MPEDGGDMEALTGDARAPIASFGEEHSEERTVHRPRLTAASTSFGSARRAFSYCSHGLAGVWAARKSVAARAERTATLSRERVRIG